MRRWVFYRRDGPGEQIGAGKNIDAGSVQSQTTLLFNVARNQHQLSGHYRNNLWIFPLVTDATRRDAAMRTTPPMTHEFQRRLHWRVLIDACTGTACRRRETTHSARHRWLDRTSAACQSIHPFNQSIDHPFAHNIISAVQMTDVLLILIAEC